MKNISLKLYHCILSFVAGLRTMDSFVTPSILFAGLSFRVTSLTVNIGHLTLVMIGLFMQTKDDGERLD